MNKTLTEWDCEICGKSFNSKQKAIVHEKKCKIKENKIKKNKEKTKSFDFANDNEYETIKYSFVCNGCERLVNSNMSYKLATNLYRGKNLVVKCSSCGHSTSFNLNSHKTVLENLPENKKNHFFNYISNHPVEDEVQHSSQPNTHVTHIHHGDSGGFFTTIIIIILLVLFWIYVLPNLIFAWAWFY